MSTKLWLKDKDARLDYMFDWSAWVSEGELIEDATVESYPAGLTVDLPLITSPTVVVWIEGGTAGVVYQVKCHIATNQGRWDDRTNPMKIAEL